MNLVVLCSFVKWALGLVAITAWVLKGLAMFYSKLVLSIFDTVLVSG